MGPGYYIKSIAGFDINYDAILLSYGILNASLLLMILNYEKTKPLETVRVFMRVDDISD